METLQNLLTIAAEATVIVGLAGIAAHAIYTQHKQFMTEFCPPVAPFTEAADYSDYIESLEDDGLMGEYGVEIIEEEPEAEAIAEISKLAEKLVTEAIPAVDTALDSLKEYVESFSQETTTEVDLTALDPAALRKLCTKHQIAWKHARGKNRHATKAMMIHQLSSRLTA